MAGKRTLYQKECRDKYTGMFRTEASHNISVKEKEYFKLPTSNDGPENYRNQNTITNRSVHTTIDNNLLHNSSKHHRYEGKSLECGAGYISKNEIRNRIQAKINVAKKSGDIRNQRYKKFLKKSADAYDMDLRQFNGGTRRAQKSASGGQRKYGITKRKGTNQYPSSFPFTSNEPFSMYGFMGF